MKKSTTIIEIFIDTMRDAIISIETTQNNWLASRKTTFQTPINAEEKLTLFTRDAQN